MATSKPDIRLSFVTPAYNEAENIEPLATRIADACSAGGIQEYEVIFVENGSWDGTETCIRAEHEKNRRIGMVQLSRNFGYQGGLAAGLQAARGEWIAVLDCDQQDPPELVLEMLKKATDSDCQVVHGVRVRRKEGPLKRLAYWLFYRLWRMASNIDVPLDAGEFCVMHRTVVDVINRMPERQRLMRGLRAWAGFRQVGFPYPRQARAKGKTKFGFNDMVGLALDGLLAFTIVPIRIMAITGLVLTTVFLTVSAVHAVFWLLNLLDLLPIRVGVLPPGLTQLNLVLTTLLGFIILCLGIIGEYVGRIYEEVKERPLFVVRDKLLP